MKNKYILQLFFTFFSVFSISISWSQTKIFGNITNDKNKSAVVAASVFISNSTIGTTSDAKGSFELTVKNLEKFDLVISCIGFKTVVVEIEASKTNNPLQISLAPKTENLDEVIIEDFKKETWEKWGKFFTESFLGKNPNAIECEILNPEIITFKNSNKKRILMAYSDSFLVIENKALGYKLKYQLENFEYNFKTGILYYEGYPLFEEMFTTKKRLKEKWFKNRKLAYEGSSVHFFKSLYSNQLEEEGFFVRNLKKIENRERKRVVDSIDSKSVNLKDKHDFNLDKIIQNNDTLNYYRKVLHQEKLIDKVEPIILKAETFAARNKEGKVFVMFLNYLHITYANTTEDENYLRFLGVKRNANHPISTLILLNNNPIEIFSNGHYYSPKDLLRSGYWSWSEKISTLLPLDYEEEE